jgi:membrane-associated phospholipid phosphatase
MAESVGTMTARQVQRFTGRSLAGLLAVAGAGVGFGLLLLLVRAHWSPLLNLDRSAVRGLNELVAPHPAMVALLNGITSLGGRTILIWLVAVVVIGLFIRRRRRLAVYLVVTEVGFLLLDPALKAVVGRLRPVVETPIATSAGNSFPSGHSLASFVTYGALLLIFLPAMSQRVRRIATAGVAALVVAVGFSRVALGVHFITDVLGAWLLGAAWLGVTWYSFRLWQRESGRRPAPITEGLDPSAGHDVQPAPAPETVLPRPLLQAAEILTGWALIFGTLYAFGVLVSRYVGGTFLDKLDHVVPQWLAAHRTPRLDQISGLLGMASDTHAILAVSLVFCPIALAALRRWRPVLFLALIMFGELSLFLASAAAVGRPRPAVSHLDGQLPTSSFPSGHIAATACLYITMALLVMPRTKEWWRWVFLALAIAMPVLVAGSRMYRGMHHPTDVMGAVVLTSLLIPLMWFVIRPNADLAASQTTPGTQTDPAAAEKRDVDRDELHPAGRAARPDH